MKRFLTTPALALALALSAPSLAHAECDLACRDREVEQSRGEPDWRTPVVVPKTRAGFIEKIVNEDRFQNAEETARKVCYQVAETSYEVAMRNVDCPNAMRALQRQAFRSAADLYNQFNVPGHEREADILSQLFMEANGTYRGQHWWLEGGA
jgi:hypothetical protein